MKKWIAVTSFSIALLGQVGMTQAMPENDYACQVTTRTQQVAVVMVQAYDRESAKQVASVALAMRLDGVKEQAQSVVECVEFPERRLSDAQVQKFIDDTPR